MRESEFCIPTSNKAVISITPNWYDRRALDTRSNYALYSSLSHLANLCQTSPKVRESLACDGGLEQLVRILKQGKLRRIPEMFQLSKWQQALLCVVNIGVRGSESVRNRVIQAGIVPITITILCNALEHIINVHRSHSNPVRIALSKDSSGPDSDFQSTQDSRVTPTVSDSLAHRIESFTDAEFSHLHGDVPSTTGIPASSDQVSISHILGSRRLPETVTSPYRHHEAFQQLNPVESIAQQNRSTDTESETNDPDEAFTLPGGTPFHSLNLEDDIEITMPFPIMPPSTLPLIPENSNQAESLSTVRPVDYASLRSSMMHSQIENGMPNIVTYTVTNPSTRPPTTWDQDVTLCLRLLAYLSKYPYLRPEFSSSYDVPRLRQNLKQFEIHYNSQVKGTFEQMSDDLSESIKFPFNVFHLVEKFTMRIHAEESTYWAGVIMRNSCRRHEQGGVRQCAYLECGKWESQSRQFAKCRRCRRTKYCSKACQSKAWVGHRYWCSSSTPLPEI